MTKLFASKKDIISIQEFMINFIGREYDGKEKLTHHVMEMYLYQKGLPRVSKVQFSSVRKNDILEGKYILVKDDNNQIFGYVNPKSRSLNILMNEITNLNKKKNLGKIRNTILREAGYTHDNDGTVITKEEWQQYQAELMLQATDKINRQKYISKRHYY